MKSFIVAACFSGRTTQWSADADDTDVDANDAPEHRANISRADQRVSVAQSRSRVRATVGGTFATDAGTNAKHGGASRCYHHRCRPCGRQYHPRGQSTDTATTANQTQYGWQKAYQNDRDDPRGGGTKTDPQRKK